MTDFITAFWWRNDGRKRVGSGVSLAKLVGPICTGVVDYQLSHGTSDRKSRLHDGAIVCRQPTARTRGLTPADVIASA
jgi:hypothetical protein